MKDDILVHVTFPGDELRAAHRISITRLRESDDPIADYVVSYCPHQTISRPQDYTKFVQAVVRAHDSAKGNFTLIARAVDELIKKGCG